MRVAEYPTQETPCKPSREVSVARVGTALAYVWTTVVYQAGTLFGVGIS